MLSGCTFDGCTAIVGDQGVAQGGALYIYQDSTARLNNCTIRNSLVNGTSDTHGAGLYIFNSYVLFSNTTILDSAPVRPDPAIWLSRSGLSLNTHACRRHGPRERLQPGRADG